MEKSGIQKLANSTFTSQFHHQSSKNEIEKCITAIKNSNDPLI